MQRRDFIRVVAAPQPSVHSWCVRSSTGGFGVSACCGRRSGQSALADQRRCAPADTAAIGLDQRPKRKG